jgi:hypothetical protein
MATTDNCWAHTGCSLPFTPSFARRFHVPLALNNIKRYQALSLSHTHTHISTFQIYKSTPEGKRTEPEGGWRSVRATVSQSPGPFLIYLTDTRGPAAKKKRPLLLFQSFHRLLLKMRLCTMRTFHRILQKVEILVSDKNKMSTNCGELFSFDYKFLLNNTHTHNILTLKWCQIFNICTDQLRSLCKVGNKTPSQWKPTPKFVQFVNKCSALTLLHIKICDCLVSAANFT